MLCRGRRMDLESLGVSVAESPAWAPLPVSHCKVEQMDVLCSQPASQPANGGSFLLVTGTESGGIGSVSSASWHSLHLALTPSYPTFQG